MKYLKTPNVSHFPGAPNSYSRKFLGLVHVKNFSFPGRPCLKAFGLDMVLFTFNREWDRVLSQLTSLSERLKWTWDFDIEYFDTFFSSLNRNHQQCNSTCIAFKEMIKNELTCFFSIYFMFTMNLVIFCKYIFKYFRSTELSWK